MMTIPGTRTALNSRAGCMGNERVDHQRQRWKEQADGPPGRHQAECKFVGVPLHPQRRVEKAADGDDRHAAPARQYGEYGACNDADDREPARQPPEERARGGDEPVRRLGLGHDVTDEREERDGDDDRAVRKAVVEHRRSEEPHVVVRGVRMEHPKELGRAPHDGEERQPENRQEHHEPCDDIPGEGVDGDGHPREADADLRAARRLGQGGAHVATAAASSRSRVCARAPSSSTVSGSTCT